MELLHRHQKDNAGNAIVHVGGDQTVSRAKGGSIIDRGIANAHHCACLLFVMGPNVNIEILQSHFLGLDTLVQADHAPHSVFKAYRCGDQVRRMEAAHFAEADKALLLNIGGDEADGVHMGCKQDP